MIQVDKTGMSTAIRENLAAVRDRIAGAAVRAGRRPEEITLIAVSKSKPAQAVVEALRAGQKVFGENRVREALEKMEEVAEAPEWHLIGHLQTNKARLVPGRFSTVHSIDSERLARALQKHAEQAGTILNVLIQVNWSREPTKSGVSDWAALAVLSKTLLECPALRLRGLMTMPDPAFGEKEAKNHCAEIRGLQQRLGAEMGLGGQLCELSMGMSHDYEWAIAEGATMVRVGTAIFGERS